MQAGELPQCSRESPPNFTRLPDNCLELIISRVIDACSPAEIAQALATCKSLHRAYWLLAASSSSKKMIGWILEHGHPEAAMIRLLRMGLA